MSPQRDDGRNEWAAGAYDDSHAFVYEYGEGVVDLLDPEPDEWVLDLGCGTGHLTASIAASGATVVGLDAERSMLAEAARTYPDLRFVRGDARRFAFRRPFDAVFSNAALHWIHEQDAVLSSVADALRPGGRFVAELGGAGNVAAIVGAVEDAASDRGYAVTNPWYFPTVGEYATRLEDHGFEVQYASLFDRPTELDDGEAGLASWLGMFGDGLLGPVPEHEREDVISAAEDLLRDELFADGTWTADYRRLRVVARLEQV
ncbi:class I SAM-dependent methyltransferase [Haloarchaeobius sp. HRN-SO-5]|uniref:class I SAM-dependent methyltransferase n=1 Tax=Haloarchaeobius sp. HRN-SO-5 TaxID=3446118 RepID=UPI003EBED339